MLRSQFYFAIFMLTVVACSDNSTAPERTNSGRPSLSKVSQIKQNSDAQNSDQQYQYSADASCAPNSPKQTIDLTKIMLDKLNPIDASKLEVSKPKVTTKDYNGYQSLILEFESLSMKNDKSLSPDYGVYKVCNEEETKCTTNKTVTWYEEVAIPSWINGKLVVSVADCVIEKRRETRASCGRHRKSLVKVRKNTDAEFHLAFVEKLEKQKQVEEEALNLAGNLEAHVETAQTQSAYDQLALTMAQNITERPHQYAGVYGSHSLEEFSDQVEQQDQGGGYNLIQSDCGQVKKTNWEIEEPSGNSSSQGTATGGSSQSDPSDQQNNPKKVSNQTEEKDYETIDNTIGGFLLVGLGAYATTSAYSDHKASVKERKEFKVEMEEELKKVAKANDVDVKDLSYKKGSVVNGKRKIEIRNKAGNVLASVEKTKMKAKSGAFKSIGGLILMGVGATMVFELTSDAMSNIREEFNTSEQKIKELNEDVKVLNQKLLDRSRFNSKSQEIDSDSNGDFQLDDYVVMDGDVETDPNVYLEQMAEEELEDPFDSSSSGQSSEQEGQSSNRPDDVDFGGIDSLD